MQTLIQSSPGSRRNWRATNGEQWGFVGKKKEIVKVRVTNYLQLIPVHRLPSFRHGYGGGCIHSVEDCIHNVRRELVAA